MAEEPYNKPSHSVASFRDTVESVWIAIVLAFVLRAFVLEAFVIPTGSMAPRLMGQHWRFQCPSCGYDYAFGYTSPEGREAPLSRPIAQSENRPGGPAGQPAHCPSCGYRHYFGREYIASGDRVLVLKYLYRFVDPAAWDVFVFKNPQDNEQNYIKRLIGRPGQMIEVVHGDVYVRDGLDVTGDGVIDERDFAHLDEQAAPWRILRKTPQTQQAMWQILYDNDYLPDVEVFARASQQWVPPWTTDAPAWTIHDAAGKLARTFRYDGSGAAAVRFTADPARFKPYYAYNVLDAVDFAATDIVTDVKLSFLFVPEAPDSQAQLHLTSLGWRFIAHVAADGTCRLEARPDAPAGPGDAPPPWQTWGEVRRRALRPGQPCRVALTHVDQQVRLWVEDEPVLMSPPSFGLGHDARRLALRGPVSPPEIAIGAAGGPCRVEHVQVLRDVYYTRPRGGGARGTMDEPMVLRKFLYAPELDEFYALGDNSPHSKDSRFWTDPAQTLQQDYRRRLDACAAYAGLPGYREGTVPRFLIIGKAFFVYWPSGFRLPFYRKLPLVPDVGRMRLIR